MTFLRNLILELDDRAVGSIGGVAATLVPSSAPAPRRTSPRP
jgi:hypothetical protein